MRFDKFRLNLSFNQIFVQNSSESPYLLVEYKNQIPPTATNNKQPLRYWGIFTFY